MRSRTLLALTAALLALPPSAQSHIVQMRGAPTCAAWSAQRPANSKIVEAWALGFVSGIAQEMDKHVPEEVTEDAIFRWLDDYCKRNPKESVALGIVMFVGKLRGENKFK
jgi:hypothetical protein